MLTEIDRQVAQEFQRRVADITPILDLRVFGSRARNDFTEALRESQILLEASAFMGTINRAYYAMFYVLLAVLVVNRLSAVKHSGAIALFDREFVKTGISPKSLSRSLHIAFDRRQRHDYGEMVWATHEVAQDTLSAARIFAMLWNLIWKTWAL